jgi:ubiquinone/menaquinone biosynthesis C-methylase UbiE
LKTYYDRRADEYDATSYELMDPADVAGLTDVLAALPPARTLDIGCGTGWLSGSLRGELVGLDQSPRMLQQYRRRHPHAALVRADGPALPFRDGAFERCFTAHLLSHLHAAERERLLAEANRVGRELVVVEQQRPADHPGEAWERRSLANGEVYEVYKRYRTAQELAADVGGTVLFENAMFVAVAGRA